MAPKAKAKTKAAPAGKAKAKKAPAEEPPAKKAKTEAAAPAPATSEKVVKVDDAVPNSSQYKVHGEFAAKLNQTNIGENNNKFYIAQLLDDGKSWHVWTHWGRVGEHGQNGMSTFPRAKFADAEKEFEKKFKDKTGNAWADRSNFKKKAGKYEMVEVDDDGGDEEPEEKTELPGELHPSPKLGKELNEVLAMILNPQMWQNVMASMKVNVKKMPLGKLSKAQLQKGNDILEELKQELAKPKPKPSELERLSSAFYSLIPHDFGRSVPPVISDTNMWNQKVDLLNTIGDIEIAHKLRSGEKHDDDPTYDAYVKLGNEMEILPPTDSAHAIILKAFEATKGQDGCWSNRTLEHVFTLKRKGEEERASQHKELGNRRLLWHGTSPAVVAAILSSGMRIMPHSGGRVGKGIYLASENVKSAGYTGQMPGPRQFSYGFMFLAEAALGKSKSITQDDSSLKCAPAGFDSVVAEGRVEVFNQKTDASLPGPFGPVAVAQGAPRKNVEQTAFANSEYLLYRESQVSMRYLCMIRYG